MFIFSLPLLFISCVTFLSAIQVVFHDQTAFSPNASAAPIDGDLTRAYKYVLKVGSSSEFHDKVYMPLLRQYKSDIIARRNGDVSKMREMVRLFLSIDSCDRIFPCTLAGILSYRVDLFDDVMNHIPDEKKGECLKMMETGVDNIVFEAAKPGVPKAEVERVLKFGTKYEKYREKYAPRINPDKIIHKLFY